MTEQEKKFKKGALGERIFIEHLKSRGYIVMVPEQKDKPHLCDIIATHGKERCIAIDVKTKKKFYWRNSQGINVSSYNQYLAFSKLNSIPFYLVFVDEDSGEVHWSDISKLKDPFYNKKGTIIYWELKQMNYLFNITQEQMEELAQYNTKK